MLRLLFLALGFLIAAHPVAAQGPLRIDLNIPTLKLVVYEGDEVIRTYPIAVGMPGFDTPTGSYSITHAEWNPWWNPPTYRDWARNEQRTPPGPNNPMGKVKLFFLPLYFIHGTPAGESIGTPASHGCVRMLNQDVVELSRLLHERATSISEPELNRIVASSSTRRVEFNRSIDVVIRYDPVVVEGSEIFAFPDIYDRGAIHSESVYQALLAAGYDVSNLDHQDVRRYVERAKGRSAPYVVKLEEVFGNSLALRAR